MWFVSKKKYDAMVAERDKWDSIAAESIKLCQEFRDKQRWEEVARSCQEDNKRLITLEEEMLTKIKELEAELQRTRQDNQQWAEDFEELDNAYGRLETDYDILREERDHYEERCRYLEDELLHYQEEEEAEWLARKDEE